VFAGFSGWEPLLFGQKELENKNPSNLGGLLFSMGGKLGKET